MPTSPTASYLLGIYGEPRPVEALTCSALCIPDFITMNALSDCSRSQLRHLGLSRLPQCLDLRAHHAGPPEQG